MSTSVRSIERIAPRVVARVPAVLRPGGSVRRSDHG